MKKLLLAIFTGLFLVACTNENPNTNNTQDTPEKENTELTKEEASNEAEVNIADANTKSFVGTFIKFSLGDRPYYDFKGEDGEVSSFMRCEDKNYKFERELPESEANMDNQGFGSNEELVGKKFKLTYEVRQEAEYIDGPIGDVKIITKVEEL